MVTGGSLPPPGEEIHRRIVAAATWHPEKARTFSRPIDPTEVGSTFNLAFRSSWVETVGLFDQELGTGGPFKNTKAKKPTVEAILSGEGVARKEFEGVAAMSGEQKYGFN